MKKRTAVIILGLFPFLGLTACNSETSYQDHVKKLCGLDLSGCTVISAEDSHGGFHGDGILSVKFDCSSIADSMIEQVKGWNTLPLTDNLQIFLYGGVRNGLTYGGHAELFGLPEIEEGYYFFLDRHSQRTDASSDSGLFDRASYNFTLLIYDADLSQLYLIEFDT